MARGEFVSSVISDVLYIVLIDYDSNDNPIYIGIAKVGTSTSDSQWRIKKLTYDANGNLTGVYYAGGSTKFDKVWDDRTTYQYS
jgi:YD repeat-containing protein